MEAIQVILYFHRREPLGAHVLKAYGILKMHLTMILRLVATKMLSNGNYLKPF